MEQQQLLAVAAYLWATTERDAASEVHLREYEILAEQRRAADGRPSLGSRVRAAVRAFNNPVPAQIGCPRCCE